METPMLLQEIEELQKKLTGDMIKDMQIREDIHKTQMEIYGIKPTADHIECLDCGS